MYKNFYKLEKDPFHITPDPKFLYQSERHKQALASIIYGIEKRKGFVAITGGVGVGKTTVIRAYLEKAADAGLKVIYLFQPNISFYELVRSIHRELGLEQAAADLVEMVDGLHLALIELYRQGKTAVIIIDEAQNMPVETLENLRMLSNLETPTERLIQIVLVGQTELEELLERYELRQLNQRIAIRSRIDPLSEKESYTYIQHRLMIAGLEKQTIFSKRALDIIVKEAQGVPRLLNVLCDNALITGFGYQKNPVTRAIAREVVNDLASKKRPSPFRKWKPAAWVGTAVFLVFLLALFLLQNRYGLMLMSGSAARQAAEPEPAWPVASKPPGELQLLNSVDEQLHLSTKGTVRLGAVMAKDPMRSEIAIRPTETTRPKQAAAAGSYKTRLVKRGDILSELIREVYRLSPKSALDPSLINLVKQHNPAIVDSNFILAGSVIRFPELEKEKKQSR
jgi:general secretion pathway protein A